MIREEIPVKLPSQGLLYPEGHPFHKKSEIGFYAMTTAEEDILTSKPLIKSGKVLNELIKNCLAEQVDPESLYFFDRNVILFAVRIATYDASYPVKLQCSNDMCEQRFIHTFDLGQTPIKYYGNDIKPCHDVNGYFEFTLPKSNIPIKFKFLTAGEENILSQMNEYNKNQNIEIQNKVSNKLINEIVEINGNKDKVFIKKFINEMSAFDSSKLREYMTSITPGLILSFDIPCPKCKEVMEINMPFGREFFRF